METSLELFEQTIDAYNSEVSDINKFSFTARETEMFTEMMLEFARNHVTEALKEASEKAKISRTTCGDSMTCGCMGNCEYPTSFINKKSIIKSYSLDNVV